MINENLLRKKSPLSQHPFIRLYKWIKTLLGELWVKWIQYKNPERAKKIQELYEFRDRHAKKMMGLFDNCINEINGLDDQQQLAVITEYDKEWRKHTAMVNTLNKDHQLLPEAFLFKVIEKVDVEHLFANNVKLKVIK